MNNICIGFMAGDDLTTESYQLCIKLEGFREMRTTMTHEEYEVMSKLIKKLYEAQKK